MLTACARARTISERPRIVNMAESTFFQGVKKELFHVENSSARAGHTGARADDVVSNTTEPDSVSSDNTAPADNNVGGDTGAAMDNAVVQAITTMTGLVRPGPAEFGSDGDCWPGGQDCYDGYWWPGSAAASRSR